MNKMVINHLEKLFVTSDAATIIKELEVVHPAAKMVVMASKQQEQEVCPSLVPPLPAFSLSLPPPSVLRPHTPRCPMKRDETPRRSATTQTSWLSSRANCSNRPSRSSAWACTSTTSWAASRRPAPRPSNSSQVGSKQKKKKKKTEKKKKKSPRRPER